jgi:NAD(P)H-flavin reductase
MALVNEKARIISNENIYGALYIMKLESPAIAAALLPGQFVHMRLPGMPDHILRRPFSVFDVDSDVLEILYQVVGYGTDFMTTLMPGQTCEVIGPVGNTWTPPAGARRVLVVGGGVGAAPVYMLTKKLIAEGVETHVILGAQTKDALVCRPKYESICGDVSNPNGAAAAGEGVSARASAARICNPSDSIANSLAPANAFDPHASDDGSCQSEVAVASGAPVGVEEGCAATEGTPTGAPEAAGLEAVELGAVNTFPVLQCATDDGSFGHAGFCTGPVEAALGVSGGTLVAPELAAAYDYVAVCGPEPLMRAVVAAANAASVPCQVSLEKRMACGVGACLSCVCETREGKKRVCVDGPIFDSAEVVW